MSSCGGGGGGGEGVPAFNPPGNAWCLVAGGGESQLLTPLGMLGVLLRGGGGGGSQLLTPLGMLGV